jgi:uncharacterized surface protein with fasciclin (FAS1) repeats
MNAVRRIVLLASTVAMALAASACTEEEKPVVPAATTPTAPVARKVTTTVAPEPTKTAAVATATGSDKIPGKAPPPFKKTEIVLPKVAEPKDVFDVIGNEGLKHFYTYVIMTEAESSLRGPGPLTVFAPSDAAFDAIPAEAMTALKNNRKLLKTVLLNHVVAGKMTAEDLKAGKVKTLGGMEMPVGVGEAGFHFGEAKLIKGDVAAPNGVICIVDKVNLPPELATLPAAAATESAKPTESAAAPAEPVATSTDAVMPPAVKATESAAPTESAKAAESASGTPQP